MKRLFMLLVFFLFAGNCFAQRQNGRIADVVSFKSFTDEEFRTSYSIAIKNKTDKIITSFRVCYMFEGLNPDTNKWGVDDYYFTQQLRLLPGETKSTPYFIINLKHPNYHISGAYIIAVRCSDGSAIQRPHDNGWSPNGTFTFGDYSISVSDYL